MALLLYFPETKLLAEAVVDKEFEALMALPNDPLKLQKLANLSRRNADARVELTYLDALLREASRQKNIEYQTFAYKNKARYYYNKMIYDSLMYYQKQAIPFLQKNKQDGVLMEFESMLINMHSLNGEYEFALMKASRMYEKSLTSEDEKGILLACENMGFAYQSSRCYLEAIAKYKKCQHLLGKQKEVHPDQMKYVVQIVECMLSLDERDSVKVYLDSLHVLLNEYKNDTVRVPEYWLWLYASYADMAVREKRMDDALLNLDKAEVYVRENTNDIYFEVFYYAYMRYYAEMGDYKKSLECEKKAAEVVLRYLKQYDPEMLHQKAYVFEKMGDYLTASNLLKEELNLSDSLNQQRFTSQLSQLRSIYGVDQLEVESEREQLSVNQLTSMKVLLSVVAVILGVIVFLLCKYKHKLSIATMLAEDLNNQTTVFMDNMSKEIRVSLSEIASLSYSLIDEKEIDERRKYATTIKVTNDALQHVIFNVLDVSKIESDKMKFDYTEVYLPGVLAEVGSAAERFILPSVTFRTIATSDVSFSCDMFRLMQILHNLLYYVGLNTTQGDITLRYDVDGENVKFILLDTGLDLSARDCQLLFDRRVQTGYKLQNMGLDLVVCKLLVSKMGGSVSVSPHNGKGIAFYITLPLKQRV